MTRVGLEDIFLVAVPPTLKKSANCTQSKNAEHDRFQCDDVLCRIVL